MNIAWFSWKDINHPQAGGAEVISDRLRLSLAKSGHQVTLITSSYEGAASKSSEGDVLTLRSGHRYSVYLRARKLYKSIEAKTEIDLVIDEMNTVPFFAAIYSKNATNLLLTYQLARSVWFYQMFFPVSLIGYLLEPLYVRLLRLMYKNIATESQSTKDELCKYGFNSKEIDIFRVGIEIEPIKQPDNKNMSRILFLGAMRPMKRPLDAIKAFEVAKEKNSTLELIMAGDNTGRYASKVMQYVSKSKYCKSIKILGRVSSQEKIRLLKESAVILVTSVKEGWGLIVTEANSQGTPAVAYNTDGLADSIVDGKTGVLVKNHDFSGLGGAACELLGDASKYKNMQSKALEHSRQFTFKNSYSDFVKIIKKVTNEKKA